MRYTERVLWDDIKKQYSKVIAWGTGPLFITNCRKEFLDLECVIDGTGKGVGGVYNGYLVQGEEYVKSIDQKTLIVIYTIYEKQVLDQIEKLQNSYVDVILFSLLEFQMMGRDGHLPIIHGKHGEDALFIQLIRELGLTSLRYMEIGVCHPIVRNNTFMLHQIYGNMPGYKGVLVEANPLCWELIEEYRKQDVLVKAGAACESGELEFYAFPNYLGHSTFIKELADKKAKRGFEYTTYKIPTYDINELLTNYCDNKLDLLSIDAEGLDEDIIRKIDLNKNDISILMFESSYTLDEFAVSLKERGYMQVAKTIDNEIWVKKDLYRPE